MLSLRYAHDHSAHTSKMHYYTQAEKIDMIFIYGECRQIKRGAVRLYSKSFPDFTRPSRSVFSNIIKTF